MDWGLWSDRSESQSLCTVGAFDRCSRRPSDPDGTRNNGRRHDRRISNILRSAGVAYRGSNGAVIRGNNNTYAGADGNVYRKNSSGSWSKYNNGRWSQVDTSAARQQASQNLQNARGRTVDGQSSLSTHSGYSARSGPIVLRATAGTATDAAIPKLSSLRRRTLPAERPAIRMCPRPRPIRSSTRSCLGSDDSVRHDFPGLVNAAPE